MASYELKSAPLNSVAGHDASRFLSEQLRVLEQQYVRAHGRATARPSHASVRQPASLGRPLGLAPPVRSADWILADDDYARRPSKVLRRRLAIGGVSLVLLSATAIVPSLIRHAMAPDSLNLPPMAAQVLRTEQFAQSARDFANDTPLSALPAATARLAPAAFFEPTAAEVDGGPDDHDGGIRPRRTSKLERSKPWRTPEAQPAPAAGWLPAGEAAPTWAPFNDHDH